MIYRNAAIDAFLVVLAIVTMDAGGASLFRRPAIPPAPSRRRVSRWLAALRIIVNAAGFALFAAVTASAFLSVFERQNSLSGSRLLLHASSAAPFAAASIGIALLWIDRNRFHRGDWRRLTHHLLLRKICFWIALALAAPTFLSIVAAMSQLPTPEQQQTLVLIHRCCAMPLAAVGLLFAWFAFRGWRAHTPD